MEHGLMTADLLALMLEGPPNEGICGKPLLSPKTVEAHVGHIFSKLGLRETERPAPPRPRVLSYFTRRTRTRRAAPTCRILGGNSRGDRCSTGKPSAAWRRYWRTSGKTPPNCVFDTVSKAVRGGSVPRGFESLPLRF